MEYREERKSPKFRYHNRSASLQNDPVRRAGREFLAQGILLEERIQYRLKAMEKWRLIATRVTPILSDMPRGSGISQARENAIIRLAEIEEVIARDAARLGEIHGILLEKLGEVDDPETEAMLEDRYIRGMDVRSIGEEEGYSIRTVNRRLGEGERRIGELLQAEGDYSYISGGP